MSTGFAVLLRSQRLRFPGQHPASTLVVASMIYVSVHSGLRVSGGDWSLRKAEDNSATVASMLP